MKLQMSFQHTTAFKHGLQKWHLKNNVGIRKLVYAAQQTLIFKLPGWQIQPFVLFLSIVSVISLLCGSIRIKIRSANVAGV